MRSGRVQEPVTVQYNTVAGSANEGEDFSPASGEIKFGIGGRESKISISLLDDESIHVAHVQRKTGPFQRKKISIPVALNKCFKGLQLREQTFYSILVLCS